MGIETTISNLVEAANKLTTAITGQIGKIEARMDTAFAQFTNWRNTVQAKDINGLPLYKSVVDLTGLPTDYFYPVYWQMPGNEVGVSEITISRNFGRDAELDPFKNGKEVHVAGLNLQLEGCGVPWNGDANFLAIKRVSQTYRETVRRAEFAMMCIARPVNGVKPLFAGAVSGGQTGCMVYSGCYLRGGLSYAVTKTFDNEVKYSRVDQEIEISQAVDTTFEISWRVRPFSITAPEMGSTYPESRMAYTLDNDKRYAAKGV